MENPRPSAEWNRTALAQNRLWENPDFTPPQRGDTAAPHGRYTGRPVIGGNMNRIIGGVYLGAHSREAIVVDDEPGRPGSEYMNQFYAENFLPALLNMAEKHKRKPKDLALMQIFQTVLATMPYDIDKSHRLVQQLIGGEKDRKIHIASYMKSHAGVCRHQAILAAYLINKLMQEKDPLLQLTGQMSLDRNKAASLDENIRGAHVWVRYTSSSGDVWILDAAQKKFGRLDDLATQPDAWEYARPEDWARIRSRSNL